MDSWNNYRTAQVTFVVIDHEIFSTVIRTVLLLWYVQKFQFLAKVKSTSTGKLLDKFNVIYCRDPEWKLPTPPPPVM
jgi:hypothetical protein